MNFKKLSLVAAGFAVAVTGIAATKVMAAGEVFLPLLVYRTGPYAPNGIPNANGIRDYMDMVNKRDGGINGVKIAWEECDTKYNTKLGVECYERLKKNGEKVPSSLIRTARVSPTS